MSANQPTSFRFPFKHPDAQTDAGFRLMQQGILDLNQAITHVKSQITAAQASVTNVTQRIDAGTTTVINNGFPVNVNPQTADYTLQQSDGGGLVVFSGTGPYALTLNPNVVQPFYAAVLNLSSGNVVASPVAPNLVNNLSSVTVLPTQWAFFFFDSVNWWALDLQGWPVTIAAGLHLWLKSYDATTGLFTATQPDYADLSGLPQLPITQAGAAHNFVVSYNSATGVLAIAQPTYADVVYGYDTTVNRPASPTNGMAFFDSTLHKPIWWDATQWVDSSGTPV